MPGQGSCWRKSIRRGHHRRFEAVSPVGRSEAAIRNEAIRVDHQRNSPATNVARYARPRRGAGEEKERRQVEAAEQMGGRTGTRAESLRAVVHGAEGGLR